MPLVQHLLLDENEYKNPDWDYAAQRVMSAIWSWRQPARMEAAYAPNPAKQGIRAAWRERRCDTE